MEIVVLASLQAGKHVVLDCSLQNAEWYAKFFDMVKMEYPDVKIGLFVVSAPRDLILARGRVSTKREREREREIE